MIVRRLFSLAAAVAAIVAAVIVCVTAAAFALYAVARIWLSSAGAAAVVAVAFALVAVGVAAWAVRKAPPPAPTAAADDVSLVEQLLQIAKARPLMALGAAAAAVTVLIRNPAVLTAILSAVLAGGAAKTETK
ncbi:hypothetical protein ACO2Q0_06505 [Phenylobacterium sp. VNQ135]|uniref:hypothetical protein n=1 Tax=Phenylobacterium sp. VNQ135 TaxID=3400922 RepID=UPI003C05794F